MKTLLEVKENILIIGNLWLDKGRLHLLCKKLRVET